MSIAPETPSTPLPSSAPPKTTRRKRVLLIAAIATASVIGVGTGTIATATVVSRVFTGGTSLTPTETDPFGGSAPVLPDGRFPSPGRGDQTAPDSTTDATAATDEQQVGVVTILTTLGYDDDAQAAGTGMILTSDGLILTNNHVIDDSTSVEVTVETTGETYDATVVGTDATTDVAVLQLDNASGLDPVALDPADDTVAIGDSVYSVGNAEGTGELVTATGEVTGLDETITVRDGSTGAATRLSSLIEVDSDVVSGDSGGPLFDDDGEVIGVISAASSGSATIVGYAIDIDTVLAVVRQIESGVETDTVQIGYPAFLGVQLATLRQAQGTATVGGVFDGMPAADAGIVAGDVITAVDGAAVTTSEQLSAAIAAHDPGDQVTITWTDASGASLSAAVTLVEGPA